LLRNIMTGRNVYFYGYKKKMNKKGNPADASIVFHLTYCVLRVAVKNVVRYLGE